MIANGLQVCYTFSVSRPLRLTIASDAISIVGQYYFTTNLTSWRIGFLCYTAAGRLTAALDSAKSNGEDEKTNAGVI